MSELFINILKPKANTFQIKVKIILLT